MSKANTTISVEPSKTIGILFAVGKTLRTALERTIGSPVVPFEFLKVSQPPDQSFGDLAYSCFQAAQHVGLTPAEFAKKLEQNWPESQIVSSVQAAGPYLNMRLDRFEASNQVLDMVEHDANRYGQNMELSGKTMMVEYLAPNTNKPLHIGHLRNGVIGTVVANLLRASGANVLRANNINDRGIHIVQSMLAYLTWGNGESPSDTGEKGDHFVGRYYVMFHKEVDRLYSEWLAGRGLSKDTVPEEQKKDIKKEFDRSCPFVQRSYEMLSLWEAGDPETISLWQKMNEWVYSGFDQTNARLGFGFEKVYYESNTYKLGREIILEQLAKGVGQKAEDGSLAIDLKQPKLSKRPITLLRADGTSVYITQDVGLAVTRFKEIAGLSGVVYVVAREQEFHFKCLFEILRQYGYPWHSRLFHLSYGMVNLPSGKMKSREGTVVDADDLVDQLHSVVASIIRKNEPDAETVDVERRAEAVALGALKYMLASTSPRNDIMFDVEKSVSFEGNTGPYLQYACVRISAIEEKAKNVPVFQDSGRTISEPEFEVVKMLCFYPEAVQSAATGYDPSILASYLYETAKSFSGFYADCPVVHDGRADAFRLAICKAVKQVLSNGLDLLGIPVPDRM